MNDKITTKWIRDTYGKIKKNYSIKEMNNDISVSISSVTTKPIKFNHSLKNISEIQNSSTVSSPSSLSTSFTINYHSFSHSNYPEVLPLTQKIVIEKPIMKEKKEEVQKEEIVDTEGNKVEIKEEGNENQLNNTGNDMTLQPIGGNSSLQQKGDIDTIINEVNQLDESSITLDKPVIKQENIEPVVLPVVLPVVTPVVDSSNTLDTTLDTTLPVEPTVPITSIESNDIIPKPKNSHSKKNNHKVNTMEEEEIEDDDDDEVIIEEENEEEEEEECR